MFSAQKWLTAFGPRTFLVIHCPKSIHDICQRPQSSLKPIVKIGNKWSKTKLLCKFLKIT
jgi:hypothetical protein